MNDIQSNTYLVAHTINECQRRLQSLDESNEERRRSYPLGRGRARVIPIATPGDHRAYHVARTGEAETMVMLYPSDGLTRVYIAPPTQHSLGVGWYLMWALRLGIVLLFPLVYSPTRTIYLLQAGMILGVAAVLWGLYRLQRWQQSRLLLRQIKAVFGLDESY